MKENSLAEWLQETSQVRTVAGLFGISVPTVWRHARSGKLPAPRKIGSSTRWNVGELRAVLSACPVQH
ncbi:MULTISPECIES: helix-turn-helix transcriptional regulator [Burkholderia]|uniref:helix-turn-helix transcriptional regulator n=1 Tax=Burkholderia TaxID=32008 RepID=UPI0009DF89DE|nr:MULTISPECIES: helix-turn-helix domain-containing protein [Burkholderia]